MILEFFFTLLVSVSLRFFIFDFSSTKFIRRIFPEKMIKCPFCQGFWCGLGSFLIGTIQFVTFTMSQIIILSLAIPLVSGYLSLIICVLMDNKIDSWEKYREEFYK